MDTKTKKVRIMKSGPPNETIFSLGSTGSGKTNLLANLVVEEERFIIIDTKKDYSDMSFFQSDTVRVANVNELADAMNNGKDHIIYDLDTAGEDPEEELSKVCSYIQAFQTQNSEQLPKLTILLDELNRFVTPTSCSPGLSDLILRGRSVKIKKMFGAQWLGRIPGWARETFTEIYAFRHTEELGLSRLEEYGFDANVVSTLEQFHCVHYTKGNFVELSLVPDGNNKTTKK